VRLATPAATGTKAGQAELSFTIPTGDTMRHFRTALILATLLLAVSACKKGKGYMTEPSAAHTR